MNSNNISVQSLMSGEVIALGALEVLSIPHWTMLGDEYPDSKSAVIEYKNDMTDMLGEIYQLFKDISMADGAPKDVAVELMWKTTPASNQPYNADIRLLMVVRAIDSVKDKAIAACSRMIAIIESTLTLQKYEFGDIETRELVQLVKNIEASAVKAVVKEEKAENLQNPILPYCYAYDIIPYSESTLARLASVLTEYPNMAVSMQLMPAVFGDGEIAEIDKITQNLNVLENGISDPNSGNISFTLAEKHAEKYKYYADSKNAPLFVYNILIYADALSAANVAGKIVGQLSSGVESSADFKVVDLLPGEVNKDNNFYPLPWAVSELVKSRGRNAHIWNSGMFSDALYRLPYIITSKEASEFFRLPVGNDRVSVGLKINKSGKQRKTYTQNIINAGDITVGKLRSSYRNDTIGFGLTDLAKHMLVVGTPGSGKTTFSVSLLDRLWKDHGIPFLVIEPAKNEYRSLVQSIPDLQVFTPGKNFISPFVFNPFVPPKGVKLETYKSTLKTAFAAGVSMTTPLDKIFEESINNCYSDFRWLDTYTIDDGGKIFNISDFIKCFQETFEKIGYTGDAKNIGRAGTVRLNSLVNLFDNYFSIPIEDMLKKPTVIELAAIENTEQKALIIALLLLSVLAYVNANYVGSGGLKNVILVEEAHVLLDADTNSGEGDANPAAIAQGLVKRMLAEIRSYGVGLIIADQSPRKVSTDVVALTDMKMVFRLVESEDKQIIADSTNMSEQQHQRLARLKPGEAFMFFNKLEEPEEVITPDYRLENNISISLSDEGIKQLSTYWRDRPDKLRPYPECEIVRFCEHTCDYERRVLAREISRRLFTKHFSPEASSFEPVKEVLSHISELIKGELNNEPFTPELLSCVKCHLWRRIRYGTKIPVKAIQIENSLKK